VSTDIASTDTQTLSPTGRGQVPPAGRDLPYRITLWAVTIVCGAIVVLFAYAIIAQSIPGWKTVGWGFFTGTNWNFAEGDYGAVPLIVGSLLTTAVALVIAVPISIAAALTITFLVPRSIRTVTSSIVELLAIVPSVIYGVWGVLVLIPGSWHDVEKWLGDITSGGAPFGGPQLGYGFLLGGVVLAVMILPTVTAITSDVFASIPRDLYEAALAVGATRGQVLRRVIVPSSKTGILGAVTLGASRALGETIMLVLLLGNVIKHPFPNSFFATIATLATEIVNNYGDFTGPGKFGVIMCLAVVLMVIIGTMNLLARAVVARNLRKLS
jgi:phosphate transport system permease protein